MKDKNGEIIKLDARARNKPRYTFRLSVTKYRHVWSCKNQNITTSKKECHSDNVTACMNLKDKLNE